MIVREVTTDVIAACDARLLAAFASRDLDALNDLLHPEAVITLPNGLKLDRTDVLANYAQGSTTMDAITVRERSVTMFGEVAVVVALQELHGTFDDRSITGVYRYTRVWQRTFGAWRLIAVNGIKVG